MKKLLLLKSLLFLCTLLVGTSAWADEATFTFGKNGEVNSTSPVVKGEITITVTQNGASNAPNFTSDNNDVRFQAGNKMNIASTGTITSVVITFTTADYASKITQASFDSGTYSYTSGQTTGTWTGSTSNLNIENKQSSQTRISQIAVTYTPSSGSSTYTVIYNGNGNTGGTAPTDATAYDSGATVTVLNNTGSLVKTGYAFSGWNTKNDGQGTDYAPGATFSISSNTTLYAKWNFVVTDGIFDFEKAGAQDPLVDYGSGITLTSNGSTYITDESQWTASNVTMEVSGKYRWWNADKTLRFYDTSYMEFSVPDDHVITKIDHVGGTFSNPDAGSMSGSSWVGASQSVKIQVSGNVKSVTVIYTTANQAITPGYANITYVTPYKMNFASVDGLKAYVATAAAAGNVTMTRVEEAVPENTPLLLMGTAGTTYNVPVVASATAPETNFLKKGDGTTVFDGTTYDYILYSDGKFYQIGSGTVATNKAYLHLDAAPSGARSLDIVFNDDETTGVNMVQNSKVMVNGYYDLQGRKVANPTKGLYIVNGKKVIIK